MSLNEDLTQIETQNNFLEGLLKQGEAAALAWLRPAYLALAAREVILRRRIDELRKVATHWGSMLCTDPWTVEMATLLYACRYCHKPATEQMTLNYGQEFAHTACCEQRQPVDAPVVVEGNE